MAAIHYFTEDSTFKLKNPKKTTTWIKMAIKQEKATLISLNYIFCSDSYLLKLNTAHLGHKTLTDIITFDYSEDPGIINGEIYVSIERVKENSVKFKTQFDSEVHRVIIHGVLHLVGYGDKKPSEKAIMRKKEEAYLSLRK
jgi:probable rRNA maturation factor